MIIEKELIRTEIHRNIDDTIREVFIAVRIETEDYDTWDQGHWLTPVELNAFINDEDSLTDVVDKVARRAERKLRLHMLSNGGE